MTNREVADVYWSALAGLGMRDSIGGMEYRRLMLGQGDRPIDWRGDEDAEGPESRVAEYAEDGRSLARALAGLV